MNCQETQWKLYEAAIWISGRTSYSVCVYVMNPPTILTPITQTLTPTSRSTSLQSCTDLSGRVRTNTDIDKVLTCASSLPPSFARMALKGQGSPMYNSFGVFLQIWPSSSSQAKLPQYPLGSPALWEAHRGSGKVATPHDLQLSPEGIGASVSQWE